MERDVGPAPGITGAFAAIASSDSNRPGETSPDAATIGFTCNDGVCAAATRSGLRVGWTEDYEKTGFLCDAFDIAIVSRAIRLSQCRSGAHLVTLRTLRRTGSLAITRDPADGSVFIERSIEAAPQEWNRHRHAPWPEYWVNPDLAPETGSPVSTESPRTETPEPTLRTGDQ